MIEQRPNVLLIMSDQQRWDTICNRTACHTPHINRLAAEGISFERSYTPSALCCPARAMLASGAYHWHNGVLNQVHVPESVCPTMKPGTITYAMRLRDAGYRTGYVGKWHADFVNGPQQYGYAALSAPTCLSKAHMEKFDLANEDNVSRNPAAKECRMSAERTIPWPGGWPWPVWQEDEGPLEGRTCHFTASRGIHLLNEFADTAGQPWLLEVHFLEPHDPYGPHVDYARKYNWKDVPLPPTWHEEFQNKPGMNRKESSTYSSLSEEDVRQAVAHYWAYCEEVDANVGRILDALEASGQAENTLVVYTSDHGDMMGNHGMFLKSWQAYEDTYRIPMAARWPGHIPAGSTASQLIHLHDWAHTFCDVAGADPLPFKDGISLNPLILDPANTPGRESIMHAYYGCEFLHIQRIVVTERYKYIFNGFDIDEMYDLENDPNEITNLLDEPALQDTAQRLRNRIYHHMDEFEDPYRGRWLYHAGRYLKYETMDDGLPEVEPFGTPPSME